VAEQNHNEPYDWWETWWTLLKLLNMIAGHAVGVVALVAVIRLLELGIQLLEPDPLVWTANGVAVSLKDIVHYFDLAVFFVFFVVALIDIVKWAWRR
jgi:hypothetical protein